MRDINRIDKYLDELKEIWKKNPDLRFTQLVLNVCENNPTSYFWEDENSIEIFKHFYQN